VLSDLGIQAMDLLGRKMLLDGGVSFANLIAEIRKSTAEAKSEPGLASLSESVEDIVSRLEAVGNQLPKIFMSEKKSTACTFAHPFMKVVGDVVMAWMLLWRAKTASTKLKSSSTTQSVVDFYQGQIKTAQYFIKSLLPQTHGKIEAIMAADDAVMEFPEDAF